MTSIEKPRKSVLITGCSAGGIGASLALAFQRRNYLVFATARNPSKIPEALSSLPNVVTLPLDVVSSDSIATALDKAKSQLGNRGLDVLVNNSGFTTMYPALDYDIEKAKAMFDVNLWGVLRMTQAFIDLLVRAKGLVLNIGSIASELPSTYQAIYNASKAAMTAMSETMRLEMRPLGVRVLVVVSGLVKTNIWDNMSGEIKLPEQSYYKIVERLIEKSAEPGKDREAGYDCDDYANTLVADVEKGRSGKIFRGALSGLVKFATTWYPQWLMDRTMLERMAGLQDLEKKWGGV